MTLNIYHTSELNFVENLSIYLNREVIIYEKLDSKKLSHAWNNLVNSDN